MPVVTISRGTFSGGRLLAEALARRLHCECLESEVLSEAASRLGVPVARLRAAMSDAPSIRDRLARERQMYLACITVALGERALDGDLVYHGHAAHLLLPGVGDVLRVRVTADPEYRIRAAMTRMGMTRTAARKYVAAVDGDRARWVDFLYGADWTNPSHYDLVLNLEHLSVESACSALAEIVRLPEFRRTSFSLERLHDVLLAARARIRIGLDPRTADADVAVKAHDDVLDVTHLPTQTSLAPLIHDVLAGLQGVRAVRCTIASATILWVQQQFAPDAAATRWMADLARRQDVAVELLELQPEAGEGVIPTVAPSAMALELPTALAGRGGVVFGERRLEVLPSLPSAEGTRATAEELRKRARGAGWRALPRDRVPDALERGARPALVVVGDIFDDKPPAVRKRLSRELRSALRERLHVRVVGIESVGRHLSFGFLDACVLALGIAALAAVYALVFVHERDVVEFFSAPASLATVTERVAVLMVATPGVALVGGWCVALVNRALRLE